MRQQSPASALATPQAAVFGDSEAVLVTEDLDGVITGWSRGAERLLGHAASAVLGTPGLRLVPPDLQAEELRTRALAAAGQHLPERHTEQLTADGRRVPVAVEVSPVRDADGCVTGVLRVLRDVSAERELRRLSRLYTALSSLHRALVSAPDRATLFDRICRLLVEAGGCRLAWIGWRDGLGPVMVPVARCGDESGYLDGLRVYTDDRPEGRGPSGTAFREGRPVIRNDLHTATDAAPWLPELKRHGLRASAAFPLRLAGDVAGTLNVYATEPDFFQAQEVALLEAAAADISFALDRLAQEEERTLAEQRLRQEQQFSDGVLNSLPGVLYFYDERGRFLRWNRNFELVTGYSAEEIAGMSPLDFFRSEDRERIAERIGEVFTSGESIAEAAFVAKDGTATPYYFTGRRLEYQGRPCLVGIGLDVSEHQRQELALRKSEERYRSTVDSIVEGCQLLGFDWTYLYLNESAERHNRRPNAELLGRRMPEAWPGIEGSEVFALLRRCMEERVPVHGEIEYVFADGDRNWFDVRCQPVPEGIFVLSIDIGERKRNDAERARLLEQEHAAKLEAERARRAVDHILESVTDAFVTVDRSWRFTYVNERAARILRRRREELLGNIAWTTLPEGIGEPFRQAYERAMRDGVSLRFEDYSPAHDAWFENRVYPSQDGLSIVFHDISERKRAERALLEAKSELERKVEARTDELAETTRFLDALISHMPNPLFYKDAKLRFLGCNRAYEQAFGVTREELVGRTVLELDYLPEDDRLRFQREQQELLAAGTTLRREAAMPFADGRVHQTLFSVSGFRRSDGSPAGVVGVIVDITMQKETEAALARAMQAAESADRMKSVFLATMSHELRTPLNSIIGFTGLLLQELPGPLNPEQKKQLGMVETSSRHLLSLINDILDLSKIEAGQLEVRQEPFDLRHSILPMIEIVRPSANAKGIRLATEVAPGVGPIVSDQRRVEQILLNLLNNAIKFTSQGSVTLEAQVVSDYRRAADQAPEPAVRLSVRDTGLGIKPEHLGTLFQPFRQIDTGLSRQHEGTGLGLAICRRLAGLLGGEIHVTSEWQRGSVFSVTLPLNTRGAP